MLATISSEHPRIAVAPRSPGHLSRQERPGTSSTVISKDSIADRVRQEILNRVLDGRLPPGARIVELEIAREFQTSQAPVRDALRLLGAQGVVTTAPFRATVVREVTIEDANGVYAVRSSLEPLAAQGAADYFRGDVESLESIVTSMLRASRQKDALGYAQQHIAFHRSLIERSGNPVLIRTWDSLEFEIRMSVRLSGEYLKRAELETVYGKILLALKRGDATKLASLLEKRISLT